MAARGEIPCCMSYLHEPEIPANTGNIARTCAATGSVLHLIKPLGFDISDKAVKRAGLDYWHLVDVRVYENLDDFFAKNDVRLPAPLFVRRRRRSYDEADYPDGCVSDVRQGDEGPARKSLLAAHYDELRPHPHPRGGAEPQSQQFASAVGVFEALRQQGFPHLLGDRGR